jgi:hypothetical protein
MSALPQAASNAPPIPRPVASSVTNNTPLTRVSLAFVERRINLYLRFGHPVRELRLDRWRRCAMFLPTAAVFCRVRWESNDYGTTRWQLMVLQTCTPIDAHAAHRRHPTWCAPAAARRRRTASAVSPAANRRHRNARHRSGSGVARVLAHVGQPAVCAQPLPAYTVERHAAYLAGEVLR